MVLVVASRAERIAGGNEADGSPVFSATCSLDERARAFSQAARSVLDVEGEEGYLAKWVEYPFPAALLERVESRL